MKDDIREVKAYYDANSVREWERFDRHPYEFELTKRKLNRYIRPGDNVLDIGGGPGRYSLYFAERGCKVTLLDLSDSNIALAEEKARESCLSIKTIVGNALEAHKLLDETYDHVLLMGPMYHLLDEADRISAVNSALSLLKTGGTLAVSFINMFAGVIFYMTRQPEGLLIPEEQVYIDKVLSGGSFSGDAFTKAYFANQNSILPFMEQFHLRKLHLFGQEGILSPCSYTIMQQTEEVQKAWLDLAEKLSEKPEYFSYAEHLMYIGRKYEGIDIYEP
jgi:2-polyprenyl-3-methyl-5-hydroxy-6-metoxy-1,4-benzoquinol methylase